MSNSRTKIAQELTPAELAEFCEALRNVPHGEMASTIIEMAAARGISIGKSGAYVFKDTVAMPWLKRLEERKRKAAMIAEIGDAGSGQTLADAAAAELGQIAFDLVTDLDGQIDMQTEEGRAIWNELTKGVKRLRDGDRALIKQLQATLKEMEDQKKAADALLGQGAKGGMSADTVKSVRMALGMTTA